MATRSRLPDPESLRSLAERSARSTNEQPAFELRAGTFGGYSAERIISTGSMGAVLAARHRQRDEQVVIKLLHPQLREDATSMARISREAHVLTRVAGDHVVRLLDAGWTEQVGPYLVLEYLEGMDLARLLEENGPLPPALAVDYLLQTCAALAGAHAAGIVHRDIKPENLFALAGGVTPRLKLLDFGICRHGPESFPHRELGAANDAGGPLLGTPAYMAPERILDLPGTDQRSDIWSLGVVLHELLTGRSLFDRQDVAETCARVVNHRFELEADRTRLPLALRGVIARCLSRRSVDRFQSVEELGHALRNASVTPERSRGYLTGKYYRHVPPAQAAPFAARPEPARPQRLRTRLTSQSPALVRARQLWMQALHVVQLALPRVPAQPGRWLWLTLAVLAALLAGALWLS